MTMNTYTLWLEWQQSFQIWDVNIAWISVEYRYAFVLKFYAFPEKKYVWSNLAEDFLPNMTSLAFLHGTVPIESVC